MPIVADVSTADGAAGFVRDAREALGGIDILVANAGGPPAGDFARTTVEQYLDAFELNCLSTIAMCYEAVPAMRERRVGAGASRSRRSPCASRSPHLILSNTARAGLTGFLKTLATEVAADGVTVNSLLPGLHETERVTALYDEDARKGLARGVPTGEIGRAEDFGADRRVPVLGARPLRHRHGPDRRRWRLRGAAVMFRHVVLLTLHRRDDGQDVRAHHRRAATRCRPGSRRCATTAVGTDVGLAEGNAHFAVVADFDDVAGYVTYRDDPEHQRIIAELIRPRLASRVAAQYEC